MVSPSTFRKKLYHWSSLHPRKDPWIEERDPYRIWISEVLLQQTRSDQARSRYISFLKRFPTLNSLAYAKEEAVLLQWQGLGYYARAKNLLRAARILESDYNGIFPQTPAALSTLPGIGSYTAAAIASFAFGHPTAVIDGNVIRVLSRILGIPYLPDTSALKASWQELAQRYLDKSAPARYNQAIMNFGALQCKPAAPGCSDCPFAIYCEAHRSGRIRDYPARKKKLPRHERHFNYFLMVDPDGKCAIHQRDHDDIWGGLHQLPMIETSNKTEAADFDDYRLKDAFPWILHPTRPEFLASKTAVLSHQLVHCIFYRLSCHAHSAKIKPLLSFENTQNLVNFAFPSVLRRFITDSLKKGLC